MRKFSKVLSVLLAMVLVFSAASIGVEAQYSAYKDSAITSYDSIDKPILTMDQYASMAMDEVDRMLAEENIKVDFDLAGLLTISADFSSMDKALDSIASVYADIESLLPTIGGDVQKLKFSALLNAPRRTTAGKSDADILVALFQFLADNAAIVAKVPYGSVENGGLDLGILSGFVDLGDKLNIEKLAKKALAKMVWPDTPKDQLDLTLTLDEYVETMINLICSGEYSRTKSNTINKIMDAIQKYVPGIQNQVNFLSDSVYDVVEAAARIALNNIGVPMGNRYLPVAIGKLCGFSYKKTEVPGGLTQYTFANANEANSLTKLFRVAKDSSGNITGINFNLGEFDMSSWGTESFVEHFNDIAGQIVEAALNPDLGITWDYSNGNASLKGNLITIARTVLSDTSLTEELFSSYVDVLSPAEVAALTDDQLVAYALRSIFNGSINACDIPSSVDTTIGVVTEMVKVTMADEVPSRDYSGMDASLDSVVSMLLDYAAIGLNQVTNMQMEFGMTPEDFSNVAMDWVMENYGGFVADVQGNNGWEKFSYIIFNLIPANWLPYRDGAERDNIYDIVFEDIVGNILNFDLAGILDLLARNPDGELNGTIVKVLLTRVAGIINYVIPGVFDEGYDYSRLENLLAPDFLSALLSNLLTGLNDRVVTLMPSLLPLLCSMLDLSTPAEFGYPYVSLEDNSTLDPSMTSSFYMYNASSGINTNATDKYGNTPAVPDALYKYHIRSIETNNENITVSPSSNIYINGGTSQTFSFVGDLSAAQDTVLKVTITYDVLEESGNVMTPTPLTATNYCYISSEKDDGNERTKADANPAGNLHLIYYKSAKYMTVDDRLSSLGDYSIDLQRNVSKSSSLHTMDATFSVTSVTLDPTLEGAGVSARTDYSVSTTKKGGTWEYNPYIVSDTQSKIGDVLSNGVYTNNFRFNATLTEDSAENISFSQYVCVYKDFGLPKLLADAVNANRQQTNYGTGDYEAEYVDFYNENVETPDMVQATVNGAEAWARYEAAVEAAAAIVYRPRLVNTFLDMIPEYEGAAWELYTATQELEACSVSSGVAGVQATLDSIIVPDTYLDDLGNEVHYDYDDARHTYFDRCDYISYTYSNFKSEKRDAEKLIAAAELGESVSSIKAAYTQHRLSLYASRLIRTRAYTTHLDAAIAKYAPVYNAGQGNYSAESWSELERAYTFATAVAAEPIGTVIRGTENLEGDGLRQSKVNEAKNQLIRAVKRLSESTTVDYTLLNGMISTAKPTYDAGAANWTAVSWATFTAAYEAAQAVVAQNLEDSEANRTAVQNAYNSLKAAFEALAENTAPGSWELAAPDEDMMVPDLGVLDYVDEDFGIEKHFMVGMYDWMPGAYDYYFVLPDGWYMETTPNEYGATEATGAVTTIYDAQGNAIDSLELVLYGDCSGDGSIDSTDSGTLVAANQGSDLIEWNAYYIIFPYEFSYSFAADLDHSGVLDAEDTAVLIQHVQGVSMINQAWAQDGDAIQLPF